MEHVALDEVADWMGPASVKRPLGKALEATGMAINYYELAPGESFAFGYHRHANQEEVFYIQSGTATFETEDGAVDVEADELIRFEPGEWQQGHNRGSDRVRALALGAPTDSETELRRECAECGERTPHRIEPTDDREALRTICETCETETGRFS